MFFMFRMGRYALRAGGSRGPKQPPQEWGWIGKTIAAVLVIGVAVQWWRVSLIVLGVLVAMTLLAGMAGHAQRSGRKADHLTEAMREYGKGGKP
jgi:hypothetical protein